MKNRTESNKTHQQFKLTAIKKLITMCCYSRKWNNGLYSGGFVPVKTAVERFLKLQYFYLHLSIAYRQHGVYCIWLVCQHLVVNTY